jgi:hypothetical protein
MKARGLDRPRLMEAVVVALLGEVRHKCAHVQAEPVAIANEELDPYESHQIDT